MVGVILAAEGSDTAVVLDVAREFVRLLGLEREVKVTEVPSSHFRSEYFAPRPPSEKLVNFKLRRRGLDRMRHWKEALAEYSREFVADLRAGR